MLLQWAVTSSTGVYSTSVVSQRSRVLVVTVMFCPALLACVCPLRENVNRQLIGH